MEKKKAIFIVSIVILALLSAFSIYSAYVDLKPKEVEVKRNVTIGSYELYYDYYSIVSQENPLWEVGSKLSGRNVFFPRISPILNVTFNLILPEENFEVEYETKLVIMSSSQEITFWKIEKTLASGKTGLNSKNLSYSFSLNVPEIEKKIESIERSLEFKGGSKVVKVVTSVYATGKVEGVKSVVKDSVEMTLKLSGSYYTVSTAVKKGKIEKTSKVKRIVPPSQKDYVIAITKTLVPVAGIAAAVYLYRSSSLSEDEKALRKFKKWISSGKLPELRMTTIELESLEDLVDAAIDTGERVIHDRVKGVYFFVRNNVLYIYKEKARQGE